MSHPPYGEKRDYPRIDILVNGRVYCTTTWAGSCQQAIAKFLDGRRNHGEFMYKESESEIVARKAGAGFTLLECMVGVVIIGLIASMGLPQYWKVLERARESAAVLNVMTMMSKARMKNALEHEYFVKAGEGEIDLTEINKRLDLNIINDENIWYAARITINDKLQISAKEDRHGGNVTWKIYQNNDMPKPMCAKGVMFRAHSCPSIPQGEEAF